jgi:endoribonuclease Dicer
VRYEFRIAISIRLLSCLRYDLFESQTSHAYVRARTRGRESHLIHMAERGNDIHRRILSRITNIDADMLRWTEVLCNSPESTVPPQSLKETINPYHSDSEDEEDTKSYIEEPATNGRIYIKDATTVLYRYAASARSLADELPENHRLFEFTDVDKVFGVPKSHQCTINLPGTPIHGIFGDPSSAKAEARRSACFKACEHLHLSNLLDFRLVPLPSRLRAQYEYEHQRSLDKDVIPDVRSGGTRSYPRQQPNFWSSIQKGFPPKLYPIVFYVDVNIDKSDPYGPLVVLTREPSPDFHLIRLFSSGIAIPVRTQRAAPIVVDEERMKQIHAFTLRLCRAIMNKALVSQLEDMAYFLLPLPRDWQPPIDNLLRVPDIVDVIPWDIVFAAAKNWAIAIRNASPAAIETDLKDAIVQDRWIEFTRRYRVTNVRKDLTPLSKPADSAVSLSVWLSPSYSRFVCLTARGKLRKPLALLQIKTQRFGRLEQLPATNCGGYQSLCSSQPSTSNV